jgi:hypothetical protein
VFSPQGLQHNNKRNKKNKFTENILHHNAKTTIKVTNEIQESYESILKLDKKYSLNLKIIVKLGKRENLEDNKRCLSSS